MFLKKVIIFTRYFTPAIKAGGPIKSIENITKIYGKKYDLLIVAGDRDLDNKIFKKIKFNRIYYKKNFKIIYNERRNQNFINYLKIIKNFNPDVIYLNSFFDYKFSILICILNKFFLNKKIIISPRGELFSEAINNKFFKKNLYIFLSKILKMYSTTVFFVNSDKEKKNAIKKIGKDRKFMLVPVFYPNQKKIPLKLLNTNRKQFKILFVSRIIRNKNLDFCLNVLDKIEFNCELNIIGEIEDYSYWYDCKDLIKNLKRNVNVNYLGPKSRQKVFNLMRKSHCLFHPSKFESFGHVIFESFLNGLPVIISDNTPWKNLKINGLGREIPVNEVKKYVNEINYMKSCTEKNYLNLRKNSLNFASREILKNKQFFEKDIFFI